jgi:ferric iron reductase FhuF-like transporter
VTSLQQAIYASHQKLGRLGASYAVWLEPPPVWETIPCLDLLTTERMTGFFERAIQEWSKDPSDEDIRAAASRFMRRYLLSVAAPAFISLTNGVAWELPLERISVVMRPDLALGAVIDIRGLETYTSADRPTSWPVSGKAVALNELRERALRPLFADVHVRSFERVLSHVHVSQRLLWSTAAENLDYYYDNALDYVTGDEAARFAADRELMLFGDTLPGIEGKNPMKDLLSWDDFSDDPRFPRPRQVRTVCCANYVVPGRNPRYCRTCGLVSQEQRREYWDRFATDRDTATAVPWPPRG